LRFSRGVAGGEALRFMTSRAAAVRKKEPRTRTAPCSSGEILQPLVTLMGPYPLHPPAPHDAAVGMTDPHCKDQEQPDHAYQTSNFAHGVCRLPRRTRDILLHRKWRFRHTDGSLHVEDSHNRTGVTVIYRDRHHSISRGNAAIVELQEPFVCRRIAHKLPDSGRWNLELGQP
jgi:hypothetical protein